MYDFEVIFTLLMMARQAATQPDRRHVDRQTSRHERRKARQTARHALEDACDSCSQVAQLRLCASN